MNLKTFDEILINSEKEIRMSKFKHKPNTGSLFHQDDSLGTSKPNWKGKIVIDDDVLKMLLDDRKKHNEPPILNLAGWQEGEKARISLKTSTWKPEPKTDFNSPSRDPNQVWENAKKDDDIPW
tara:strand:- start:4577 stop:4945 length:369 start_codon:yes stop_codon:yes gene_type:complete